MSDPVEIMARARCNYGLELRADPGDKDVPICGGPDCDCWRFFCKESRNEIAALEAAGYRIAGPEPTDKMVREANYWASYDPPLSQGPSRRVAAQAWAIMHAALPTYGGE